ncbi:hypothetical protein [Dokdonella sp.]|uniref:hypothetical protein n=1 Tax=Dokdonella sp. TaxID=2291710 RepID=UPI001B074290|nr:hypothetical protein [Dokdonella sp.]MBO9662999.1 hypothetical protein [Dokdonella sp.]
MALLEDILNRYLGGAAGANSAAEDFSHVAQNVPPDVLSKGIGAAFGSNATPDVGQMVAQTFANATPEQRAALLNHLAEMLGPNAGAVLGGLLGQGGAVGSVTADQAQQVDPQQVQVAVTQAQRHDPGIVDGLSDFYAQHSGLIKTLGGAALTIALAKISQHMKTA